MTDIERDDFKRLYVRMIKAEHQLKMFRESCLNCQDVELHPFTRDLLWAVAEAAKDAEVRGHITTRLSQTIRDLEDY